MEGFRVTITFCDFIIIFLGFIFRSIKILRIFALNNRT